MTKPSFFTIQNRQKMASEKAILLIIMGEGGGGGGNLTKSNTIPTIIGKKYC